jgi:magnesium-transporting ATPase (P-type)
MFSPVRSFRLSNDSSDNCGKKENTMILSAFTLFHVVLSLVGIGSGFVVLYGLLASKRMDGWTMVFLTTTVATSVTGFLFPVHQFLPSHGVAILSLIALAMAILARYRFQLAGPWRRTYAITAVIALYFNVFVLIVQLFEKVPSLKELAPTQSETPFKVAQAVALLLSAFLTIRAATKFHAEPPRTA